MWLKWFDLSDVGEKDLSYCVSAEQMFSLTKKYNCFKQRAERYLLHLKTDDNLKYETCNSFNSLILSKVSCFLLFKFNRSMKPVFLQVFTIP